MNLNAMTYEKEDQIAVIRLNKPKTKNTINDAFLNDLDQIIDEISEEDEIGAAIITGSEKIFAAGADLKQVSSIGTPVEIHSFVSRVQSVFNRIERWEKPFIAAVNGLALGGGCELSLVCDIRIAAEDAMFGQPEIKIGVIPGAGGTQRLPRLIGLGRAKELLYTGDPVDAQEAYRIGLVNKVVPVGSLMDEAKKMARKFIKQPGFALKVTKMVVNEGINMDIRSALAHEARCFELLFSTEDQKEGMKAFLEKREPVFKNR